MNSKSQLHVLSWLGAAAALLICPNVFGQFIVDADGPRNAFIPKAGSGKGPATDPNALSGWNVNLQTSSDPSLDLNRFYAFPWKDSAPEWRRYITVGGDVKATANNGISDFFKFDQAPQLNFSGILNKSLQAANDSLHSFTLDGGGLYENNYAIYDPARPSGTQKYSRDWLGADVTFTYGFEAPPESKLWGWFNMAIGLGYTATNNYASLPQDTIGKLMTGSGAATVVGSGKSVRYGSFHTYDAYPLTLLVSVNLAEIKYLKYVGDASTWLPAVTERVFFLKSKFPATSDHEWDNYEIICSPEGSFIPSSVGKPTDSVGLNLVLQATKTPIVEKVPVYGHQTISYPISIFVDRQNAFEGKPSVNVGAALTFHFP